MKEIYIEPIGTAELVGDITEIPTPNEFVAAFDGYRFYKIIIEFKLYAIKE
jgi:hypothetical protein